MKLCFPFLQRFVIAAFGFDYFAGVWVFINLRLARLAAAGFGLNSWIVLSLPGSTATNSLFPKSRKVAVYFPAYCLFLERCQIVKRIKRQAGQYQRRNCKTNAIRCAVLNLAIANAP
jgi:hypothetical protein